MSLEKYKQKRQFEKTPEPTGGKGSAQKLAFVIQKHAASHLHYDFRLEMRGVLKSWAVPKGPSLNPEDKRLAMMVEDHPFDYKDFEGNIPKGNYGAGSVIIWDEGTYELAEGKGKSKKEQEKELLGQLFKGSLKITLFGKKIKGDYALVKAPDKGQDNAWFLIKTKDKYATTADVTKKNKSVISNITVEQMAQNADARQWKSNRSSSGTTTEIEDTSLDRKLLQQGSKQAFPGYVQPMLATLVKHVENDEEWLYEVKWDGYRIIAAKHDNDVKLYSRSGQNYSKYYEAVIDAVKEFDVDIILDGELVVLNQEGKPDFDALQAYKGDQPLAYYVFDVLWIDGFDVTGLPLTDRKKLLQQSLPANETIKYSDDFDDGLGLLEQVNKLGLEGIVAKRKQSIYALGKRTKDWLKLPTDIKQEFVIGGWTESDSGRLFRSLLFGSYQDGKFHFVGHAGSGFKEAEMPVIMQQLQQLEVKKKPFVNAVDHETTPHWVNPQLVALIKFATFTKSGRIRKPASFLGFRKDKDPKDVVNEIALTTAEEKRVMHAKKPVDEKQDENLKSNWGLISAQKTTSESEVLIGDLPVVLTNVEQAVWKGIPKATLIEYYHRISPFMLPYIKDRPQSMHIKLHGATRPGFYIKDMENNQPSWAEVFSIERKHKKKDRRAVIDYLVCQNEATLLYMINLGCIDINPWTSTIHHPFNPDFVIIDLDPSDDDFNKAIETANAAKEFFSKHKITAFPKTSGKTGIHIYLPCANLTFPQARSIAEHICSEIQTMVPAITTTEITVSKRGDKLYIDPNQNDEADTVAAPYAARPFHHPSVSTPLDWKEIKTGLDPLQFDINTIFDRLERKGDLFANVLEKKHANANTKKLLKWA
jgi:bifunctional non-homologous end joining protein LigD